MHQEPLIRHDDDLGAGPRLDPGTGLWLLRYVAGFHRDEMLLVTVLALCFGGSLLAVELGYSVALGAFTIVAEHALTHGVGFAFCV